MNRRPMIYEYKCFTCNNVEEIIKPVAEYDWPEFCRTCKGELTRLISPPQLMNISVEDSYFSVPLGRVVKGRKEECMIAKRNGLIEVGNEKQKDHIEDVPYMDTAEILQKEGLN